MSFQILNSEGVAIPINELDKEAYILWGVESDPKYYAQPDESIYSQNWFDKIGWMIHAHALDWTQMEERVLAPFIEYPIEEIMSHKSIWGHIELIRQWKSKGYIPKQIIE